MSRYSFSPLDPSWKVAVGWDRPLNTYFAIVEIAKDDGYGDQVILWAGLNHGEISRPEDLTPILKGFAELPDVIVVRLREDRGQTLDKGNSSLQREMLKVANAPATGARRRPF